MNALNCLNCLYATSEAEQFSKSNDHSILFTNEIGFNLVDEETKFQSKL